MTDTVPSEQFNSNEQFLEELPEGCPPEGAHQIEPDSVAFRFVRDDPPSLADFESQRKKQPQKKWNISECQARGLSVYCELGAANRAMKLPYIRKKFRFIARVLLRKGAGYIQQTGTPDHHTWWPLASFDVVANSEVING